MNKKDAAVRQEVEQLLLEDLHENYGLKKSHIRALCVGEGGAGYMDEADLNDVWGGSVMMPNWFLMLLVAIKKSGGLGRLGVVVEEEIEEYIKQSSVADGDEDEYDDDEPPGRRLRERGTKIPKRMEKAVPKRSRDEELDDSDRIHPALLGREASKKRKPHRTTKEEDLSYTLNKPRSIIQKLTEPDDDDSGKRDGDPIHDNVGEESYQGTRQYIKDSDWDIRRPRTRRKK